MNEKNEIKEITSKISEISINSEAIEYIDKQIKFSVCEIKFNDDKSEIGFFCTFPVPNDIKLLPVLIINNFILPKEKETEISIFNNNKKITIKIYDGRKLFSIEKCNITVIELKKEEYTSINLYFYIDEDVYEENINQIFENKSIYILYFSNKEQKIKYSLGKIKSINEENFSIDYSCDNEDEEMFCLLLNLNNYKIIGIKNENETNDSCYCINALIDELDENNDSIDEITIIYKNIKLKESHKNNFTEKKSMIKLFGENFVENNKNECKITINGEERELCSFYESEILKENELFEIKLKGIKKIIDASYMFFDCISLYSLPDISQWNTYHIVSMSHMFDGCKSLVNLPEISKWNTTNVEDMSYMFKDCCSLHTFPYITKWKNNNLLKINHIFFKSNNTKKNIDKKISDLKAIKVKEIDIPQLQEIYLSYWNEEGMYSYYEFKRIIMYNESYCYKINDELIAFCLVEYKLEEKMIYIDLLCVKKEFAGNHYGKSILKFCIENCKKLNHKSFALHVSTRNTIAMRIYESLGFKIQEYIKDYYSEDETRNNNAYFMILNY